MSCQCKIVETKDVKICRSEDYNFNFDKRTGFFQRWGKTVDDDPQKSVFGPEILDIEITDQCPGIRNANGKTSVCSFCYKSNVPGNNTHMSLETFKNIIDKFPKTLGQIALGADAQATANPDTIAIMEYARSKGIVPNITVADISEETADNLARLCGAVAVSFYPEKDKNRCYDSVKMLTDRGMTQTNIHAVLSLERYDYIFELIEDRKTDPRLQNMKAIVFLSLKQHGRGKKFERLGLEKFKKVVDKCLDEGIAFGFDSCSAKLFEAAIKDHPQKEMLLNSCEPCESGLFSAYIDNKGFYYPCSFYPGSKNEWSTGIDVKEVNSFSDVWNHPRTEAERNILLNKCRSCPIYEI